VVEAALSVSTFAIASRQRLGGLRARLSRNVLAAQVDVAAWEAGGNWEREESASIQGVRPPFLPMAERYGPLVERVWYPRG
jgi:hypothetical protein